MATDDFCWTLLPDCIILKIFSYLDVYSALKASETCLTWHRIALDNILWKEFFYRFYKINRSIPLTKQTNSYLLEYKRLCYEVPLVESEVLESHTDEVLHVSFSHSGKLFVTTSKDNTFKVWNAYPVTLIVSHCMQKYSWKYTQFSLFNANDSLLLVSGVHNDLSNINGEIAIYKNKNDKLSFLNLIPNKPFDIFGAWLDTSHVMAATLDTNMFDNFSSIWVYKIDESKSPKKRCLFKFKIPFFSLLHYIIVAYYPCREGASFDEKADEFHENSSVNVSNQIESHNNIEYDTLSVDGLIAQNTINNPAKLHMLNPFSNSNVSNSSIGHAEDYKNPKYIRPLNSAKVNYTFNDTRNEGKVCVDDNTNLNRYDRVYLNSSMDYYDCIDIRDRMDYDDEININDGRIINNPMNVNDQFKDRINTNDRTYQKGFMIIGLTGSLTYSPHEVIIKRMSMDEYSSFLSLLDQKLPISDLSDVKITEPDVCINMHGHIVGICLSPDHKLLYVNLRSWPANSVISDPFEVPPISQEIEIRSIDMETFKVQDEVFRSHRAFTDSDNPFFLYLDSDEKYILSGSENKQGYMWDRHYNICLGNFPHTNVVSSVSINPVNPNMAVSACDDFTVKVWRSKKWIKEHKL